VPVPWDLTAHFRGCSSKELLPFSGISDLQKAVMNSFREAVFLQQGSASPFMRLPKQQQTQLWDAISKSQLEGYTSVQQQLMCPTLRKCKSLAVRLHLWGPPHATLLVPAAVFSESGDNLRSVRDYLLQNMPPLLDESGELAEGVEVLTQGISVPLETPMYWLALNAAYMDQFVHLVARVPDRLLRPPMVLCADPTT
ncbi:unnamed protein product, partial [Polarella glacialis]